MRDKASPQPGCQHGGERLRSGATRFDPSSPTSAAAAAGGGQQGARAQQLTAAALAAFQSNRHPAPVFPRVRPLPLTTSECHRCKQLTVATSRNPFPIQAHAHERSQHRFFPLVRFRTPPATRTRASRALLDAPTGKRKQSAVHTPCVQPSRVAATTATNAAPRERHRYKTAGGTGTGDAIFGKQTWMRRRSTGGRSGRIPRLSRYRP